MLSLLFSFYVGFSLPVSDYAVRSCGSGLNSDQVSVTSVLPPATALDS